jgi:spore maturation protein CgeB
MKILYIGHAALESTSRHRADALTRLGHEVIVADPYAALATHLQGRLRGALHYRTGYRFLQPTIKRWLTNRLQQRQWFDIVWVDNGELLGVDCVRLLRSAGLLMVLYNHDDPTGKRDGHRFDSLLKSLPLYDVCAVVRQENIEEFAGRGAKVVMRVWMSYDEVMHAPYQDLSDVPANYRSEVVFIGTWMRGEGRDQFVLDLVKRGIPVSIWGQRWEKSPLWAQLKGCYRGGNLSGRDYVAAIQGAKVCLGMLSKGNRDLHTTRTMEIPYAGGVLCAERTSEHLELYKDGVEAVFWNDVDECAQQCRRLLDDEPWRESVRRAGMARVRASHLGHEDICGMLIDAALEVRAAQENHQGAKAR